ncbi:MAG TPA: dihydrofolate reductase [Candidatus Cloacimonadota bacterium]|nr:dihydrofolate reductase [Candidatus Cloacimonadota bacterium]
MSVSSDNILPNLAIIVAMDSNRLIGKGNRLPWRIPEDLKYFRAKTLGHTVIMGKNTWQSLGKPLDQRTNVVLTHDLSLSLPGVVICHSLGEILEYIGVNEAFVIGGAEIFRLFLPLASRLFITHIEAQLNGDTYFPDYDPNQWEMVFYEKVTSETGYKLSFNEYRRK